MCSLYISADLPTHAHLMATAASAARAIAPTCASGTVQPHARPYPSHAQVHIYVYIFIIYMQIHICTCIHTHTYNPSLLRAALPAHVHTRACACAHVCAHTARAASTTRRSASRPRWRPARAGKGGAYSVQIGDRRGVPRADVRVERRRRLERLRAEPRRVDADGGRSHVSARMRARPIAHARARAWTQHVRACGASSASSAPARDRTRMQEHTHAYYLHTRTYLR